ncbi:hypothetical protein H257_15072 [Aphanomyces astaci]|uniref:Uncharacterized protein n=1 Tax=Aphanomyces astaci TaxID=112090 RepID=W4FNP8_APHAT|nr:hypothetical protein H257_15072 [Aphanomyces astaci]ETV69102.1 hypothetical protein H257_15072 [Aphanomyces astaci]|eukprot:XP_009841355.1 hypothetical protein H257_15072 [Aphanomyces astaci]
MQTSYMHHPATSQCTIPASPKSFASSILPDGSGRPPLRLVAPSTQSSPCKIVTTTHPTIQWEWLAHSLETHPSAWSSLAATSHAARAATDAIQTILVAMLYMASALSSPQRSIAGEAQAPYPVHPVSISDVTVNNPGHWTHVCCT